MTLILPQNLQAQMTQHAEKEYPSECCGLALASRKDPDKITEIFSCRNVQDEFHLKDSATYPRTSRTAYLIDPRDLLTIHKKTRQEDLLIRLIYHSHIDAPVEFSEEDHRQALWEGEPIYPGAAYFIASVQKKKVVSSMIYSWDPLSKRFYPSNVLAQ